MKKLAALFVMFGSMGIMMCACPEKKDAEPAPEPAVAEPAAPEVVPCDKKGPPDCDVEAKPEPLDPPSPESAPEK